MTYIEVKNKYDELKSQIESIEDVILKNKINNASGIYMDYISSKLADGVSNEQCEYNLEMVEALIQYFSNGLDIVSDPYKPLPLINFIEAYYLHEREVVNGYIVEDESGNGIDAYLVNANAGNFDGVAYGLVDGDAGFGDPSLNSANEIELEFYATLDNEKTGGIISTVINTTLDASDNPTTVISHDNGYLYVYFGGIYKNISKGVYADGGVHKIDLVYKRKDGNLYIYFDDGLISTVAGDFKATTNQLYTSIGKYRYGAFKGLLFGLKFTVDGVVKANWNIAEGGLSDTLYNTNGSDAVLNNATLSDFWSIKQDLLHYNIVNGFDLWSNGNPNEDIRVPIGKTVTQEGYLYMSTNIGGIWHNNAESNIQLPVELAHIQDNIPISSLTNNKFLKWENDEIKYMTRNEVNNSIISEEIDGTRVYSPDGDDCQILSGAEITPNITYKYYIKIESISGESKLTIGGVDVIFNSSGIFVGEIVASDTTPITFGNNGICDVIVSQLYIWESGTIPPLSYEEMELNFNNKNTVFSNNTEENKYRYIVLYDRSLSDNESSEVVRSITQDNEVLTDENGEILTT